jgi:peroxiredoxin
MSDLQRASAEDAPITGGDLGAPATPSESLPEEAQGPGQADFKTSMRQLIVLVLVAAAIVAVIWGIDSRLGTSGADKVASSDVSPEIGHPAPDFALTDLNGNVVRLSALRGKRVVINFWASWCPPCRAEMPDLEALSKDSQADTVVLGVNMGEDRETVAEFVRSQGITFQVLLDPDQEAAMAYGPSFLPTTYFVDANGIVRESHYGAMKRSTMDFKLGRAR